MGRIEGGDGVNCGGYVDRQAGPMKLPFSFGAGKPGFGDGPGLAKIRGDEALSIVLGHGKLVAVEGIDEEGAGAVLASKDLPCDQIEVVESLIAVLEGIVERLGDVDWVSLRPGVEERGGDGVNICWVASDLTMNLGFSLGGAELGKVTILADSGGRINNLTMIWGGVTGWNDGVWERVYGLLPETVCGENVVVTVGAGEDEFDFPWEPEVECGRGLWEKMVRRQENRAPIGEEELFWVGKLAGVLDVIRQKTGSEVIILQRELEKGEGGVIKGVEVYRREGFLEIDLIGIDENMEAGVKIKDEDLRLWEWEMVDKKGARVDWDPRVWGAIWFLLPRVVSRETVALVYGRDGRVAEYRWGDLKDKCVRWQDDVWQFPYKDGFLDGEVEGENEFGGTGWDMSDWEKAVGFWPGREN